MKQRIQKNTHRKIPLTYKFKIFKAIQQILLNDIHTNSKIVINCIEMRNTKFRSVVIFVGGK